MVTHPRNTEHRRAAFQWEYRVYDVLDFKFVARRGDLEGRQADRRRAGDARLAPSKGQSRTA
jgi:hypothetical protein